MKRFILRQLALALAIAMLLSLAGVAEDLPVEAAGVLSTDAEVTTSDGADPVDDEEIVCSDALDPQPKEGDAELTGDEGDAGDTDPEAPGAGSGDEAPEGGEIPSGDGEEIPSGDGGEIPSGDGEEIPSGDGEEIPSGDGEQAPTGDGEQVPSGDGEQAPTGDGEQVPSGDGEQAPTGDGEEAPTGDGEEAPTGDGEEAPTGDGEEAPTGDAGEQPSDATSNTETAPDSDAADVLPAATGDLDIIQSAEPPLPIVAEAVGFPSALVMGVKEKYQLVGGAGYVSLNPKVATVDATGLVIAKKTGSATITAGALVCQVTVRSAPKGIKLPKKQATVVGQSIILVPKVSGGASATITWTSSNPGVAMVDANGMVTGVGIGKAKITARTYNKKRATCTVTVESANAPTSVSFPMGTLFVGKGESVQLKPVLNPGAETTFTYTSKNKKVATVSKTGGVVKGKKLKKSTKITVKTHNKKKATLNVKVLKAPTSVALSAAAATLDIGGSTVLSAMMPAGTASQVIWTSSNPGVATVSDASPFCDGTSSVITVTATGAGTATITAMTFNGQVAACTITVNAPPAPAPAPSGGGSSDTNTTPKLTAPDVTVAGTQNLMQGGEIKITASATSAANASYKAIIRNKATGEEITQELSAGEAKSIDTSVLPIGDYEVVVVVEAPGYESAQSEPQSFTVQESDELVPPKVTIATGAIEAGSQLEITINNADQGKGETYSATLKLGGEVKAGPTDAAGNKITLNLPDSAQTEEYELVVTVSSTIDNTLETQENKQTINVLSAFAEPKVKFNKNPINKGKKLEISLDPDVVQPNDVTCSYHIVITPVRADNMTGISIIQWDGSEPLSISTSRYEPDTYTLETTVSATDGNRTPKKCVQEFVVAPGLTPPWVTLGKATVVEGQTQTITLTSYPQPEGATNVEYTVKVVDMTNGDSLVYEAVYTDVIEIAANLLTKEHAYKVYVETSAGEDYEAAVTTNTFYVSPGLTAPTLTFSLFTAGKEQTVTITNSVQPVEVIYDATVEDGNGTIDITWNTDHTAFTIPKDCMIKDNNITIKVTATASGQNANDYPVMTTEQTVTVQAGLAVPALSWSSVAVTVGKEQTVTIDNIVSGVTYTATVAEKDNGANALAVTGDAETGFKFTATADNVNKTYILTVTATADDFAPVSETCEFTVLPGLSVPTLEIDKNRVTLGTPVVVTVSGDQPAGVNVEYTATIVNVEDENDTTTGDWNGNALTIGTAGLTEDATYSVSVTVSAGEDYMSQTSAPVTFTVSGYVMANRAVTGYVGSATELTIPEVDFNNEPIEQIAAGAFKDKTGITSVIISADVTEIGASAFMGCTSLTTVTIPNGVETIGEAAFSGCSALTTMTPYTPDN